MLNSWMNQGAIKGISAGQGISQEVPDGETRTQIVEEVLAETSSRSLAIRPLASRFKEPGHAARAHLLGNVRFEGMR